MTGRRLYDHYCDATAAQFTANRGAWRPADTPLPAWPSLSNDARKRWNELARRITPKPKKPAPVYPEFIVVTGTDEKKIQAIKEMRSLMRWELKETVNVANDVNAGRPHRITLPSGVTVVDAKRILTHWVVA